MVSNYMHDYPPALNSALSDLFHTDLAEIFKLCCRRTTFITDSLKADSKLEVRQEIDWFLFLGAELSRAHIYVL